MDYAKTTASKRNHFDFFQWKIMFNAAKALK